MEDDGQHLGIVNDRPAEHREQAGRGLVALQEPADRRHDLRPRAEPAVTADQLQDGLAALVGPFEGRPDQGDALGVILGAVRVEIIVGDDGLCRLADFGVGIQQSLRNTAV